MAGVTHETMRLIAMRLQRRGDGDLAEVVRHPEAWERLNERRKAQLDAEVFGTGFLVDDRRVDPTKVVVCRPREDEGLEGR